MSNMSEINLYIDEEHHISEELYISEKIYINESDYTNTLDHIDGYDSPYEFDESYYGEYPEINNYESDHTFLSNFIFNHVFIENDNLVIKFKKDTLSTKNYTGIENKYNLNVNNCKQSLFNLMAIESKKIFLILKKNIETSFYLEERSWFGCDYLLQLKTLMVIENKLGNLIYVLAPDFTDHINSLLLL